MKLTFFPLVVEHLSNYYFLPGIKSLFYNNNVNYCFEISLNFSNKHIFIEENSSEKNEVDG